MSDKYQWFNTASDTYPSTKVWTDLKLVTDEGRGWVVTYKQQTEYEDHVERRVWRVLYRDELQPESIPIADCTEEELRLRLYQRALVLGMLQRYEENVWVETANET